jgi:hypothetical protein
LLSARASACSFLALLILFSAGESSFAVAVHVQEQEKIKSAQIKKRPFARNRPKALHLRDIELELMIVDARRFPILISVKNSFVVCSKIYPNRIWLGGETVSSRFIVLRRVS